MRDKTDLTAVGEDAVRRVANGESEIVIVESSEIVAVPGAELVGSLPGNVNRAIEALTINLKQYEDKFGTVKLIDPGEQKMH